MSGAADGRSLSVGLGLGGSGLGKLAWPVALEGWLWAADGPDGGDWVWAMRLATMVPPAGW